jgi:hypothetical protein
VAVILPHIVRVITGCWTPGIKFKQCCHRQ